MTEGELADARALASAFDTSDDALQACRATVDDLADEREQRADEQLDRAMDTTLPIARRAEALAAALVLNADLADDPDVVALDPVLDPPSPDGPCETADELLATDLDGAEAIFTQLSKASDDDLKACGELGLAKVAAARVASQQRAGSERAERWWDDMVDDFLVPAAEIIGGTLVVALVVAAVVKLLGAFAPWRKGRPFIGTLAVAGAGAIALAGHFALDRAGWVEDDVFWPGAIVLLVALGALTALAWATRGRPAERTVAVGAGIAGLATAVVWTQDLLSDRTTDWWNLAPLGLVGVAGLVSLVIAQTARARLVIDPVDASTEEVGTEFAWLVRERFLSIGSGPPRGLELVIGTDQAELPTDSIGELAPNAIVGALLKVVRALTPTTTYRLTGQLHEKKAADGASVPTAVTLSLRTSLRPPTMMRFDPALFATDADPGDEARSQLATAGAAWLLLQLLDQSGSERRLGGASSWESVALQAIASQRIEEESSRLALLARSVDYDTGNLAARLGRATTAIRVAKADDAIDLRRAHEWAIGELDLLEAKGGTEELNAGLRVRLAYNSSAMRIQLAELIGSAPENAAARAALIDDARNRLQWLFRQILTSEPSDGAPVELGPFEPPEAGWSGALEATYAELESEEADDVDELLRRIKSTVFFAWLSSVVLAHRWSSEIAITPTLTTDNLTNRNVSLTSPRAAYNLACAASHGRGEVDVARFVGEAAQASPSTIATANLALALASLRVAVQDPRHRAWGRNDPSLDFVRNHSSTSDVVEELLAEPTKEKPTKEAKDPETHVVLLGRAPRPTPGTAGPQTD